MDPNTGLTSQQALLYFVLFGAGTGLVLGLIPLLLGLKRGKRRLGILGFAICLVGGAIAGLIVSVPAVIIFTWLIVRKAPNSSERDS